MQLSKRLQAVADMVTVKGTVCDIGCDHGYVAVYLIQKGACGKVIATDVRPGPLARAKEHIADYGLEEYIETRLSDGLSQVEKYEAEAAVCAGMGGRLMQRILTQGADKAENMRELVLQPQSELAAFRKFLKENGYVIAGENMVFEEGKFYPILHVTRNPGQEAERPEELSEDLWERLQFACGPWLLKKRHPILRQFLQYERKNCSEILARLEQEGQGERIRGRIRRLEKEQEEIEAALRYMDLGESKGDNV